MNKIYVHSVRYANLYKLFMIYQCTLYGKNIGYSYLLSQNKFEYQKDISS